MYLVICDFQASSLSRRSFAGNPAHQAAAWCARSTVKWISCSPQTGKVAMTSDVAGFSVSNVSTDLAGPCVQVVVAIALTVIESSNSGRRMPSKSSGVARKIPLASRRLRGGRNRSRREWQEAIRVAAAGPMPTRPG
jgi:hypothetical protein